MLFAHSELPFDDTTWRRINMRKVSHLVGAETLHNLYNRHWPRINSLRFRHTIVNYKDGIVEAYAPVQEWTYLQRWLAQKFLVIDPILIREIKTILDPPYDLVDEIIAKVDACELADLNNQELALLLIDIVDLPLGDIYKLNVVQIEYGLNFALQQMLAQYEPNPTDRNELLSTLIAPGMLTVSQEEEVAFGEIVRTGKAQDITDPAGHETIRTAIQAHYDQFASTHCAYGEEPPTLQDYYNKYIFLVGQSSLPPTREEALAHVARQKEQSQKLLTKLNNADLTTLCNLMAHIGVFRDYNKAKLGETITRRLQVLDEIARRTSIPRDVINYYLMAELTTLLDTGEAVAEKQIIDRKEQGVCFRRNEEMTTAAQSLVTTQAADTAVLEGICASPGLIEAPARIIYSKEDIAKVSAGDIMVAIGTDFDLLEIMNLSGGIITEEGGLLSHASVVSRELQKPCLIGVPHATTQITDGTHVRLNATKGTIEIL